MRYECFVVRKGWVTANPSHGGREFDRYDPYCHHLGVFQGSQLIAYLRA
ncbi:MAG: GNAT family N-acetyltransferase, partial [Abitibacteriaceae bacterium]|nr:GNAT family N-acetyltransferase [Abditibacteriaceae bacterium]